MKYDFDTAVIRKGNDLGKYMNTPQAMKDLGFLAYTGAEMDFKTAPCIMNALAERSLGGIYGATKPYAEPYLERVVWWMKRMRNWEIKPEWIALCYGIVHGTSVAVRAFTEPGDGVIIQEPVYTPFRTITERNGRRVLNNTLLYNKETGEYNINFDELEELMRDHGAKLMILCNPHNPCTRVWNLEELTKIAALAGKYGVKVYSDEIYAELTYPGHECVPFVTVPGAEHLGMTATSIGKDFNFVGTKHANIIIPDDEMRARFRRQTQMENTEGISPFMDTAVRAAYTEQGYEWVRELVEYGAENVRTVREFFAKELPGITLSPNHAGLLMWSNWNGWGMTETELKAFLNNEALWDVKEGSSYGEAGRGFCRIAIGTPRAGLQAALERLAAAAHARGLK